jgi:hypothetical protein
LITPLVIMFQRQPALMRIPDLVLLFLVYAIAYEVTRPRVGRLE